MSTSVGSAYLDVTATTAKALAALRAMVPTALSILKPLGTPIDLKVNTTGLTKGVTGAARQVSETVTGMQAQVNTMFRGLSTEAATTAKNSATVFQNAAREEQGQLQNYRQNLQLKMRLTQQAAQQQAAALQTEVRAQAAAGNAYRQNLQLNLRLKRDAISAEEAASRQAAQNYRQTLALNGRLEQEAIRAQTLANKQAIDGVTLAYQKVRTAADKAFAGAHTWKENRDAAVQYQQGMRGVETELQKVQQRAGLTEAELTKLAKLEATLARESATLAGKVNPLGLSGNISSALKAFQGLAPVLGTLSPSLGAAAAPLQLLSGGFGELKALLNPVTIGIGLAVVTVGGMIVVLKHAVDAAADFQQQMKGIQSTTEASGTETDALGKKLLGLTRILPVTSEQLTGVARNAVLFGVRGTESITNFTKTIAQLGVVTRNNNKGFTDLSALSEQLVKFLNETGSTAQTFNKDLKDVATTLASVDQNTASTITQTLELSKYMAAGSVTLGLTRGQIIGLSGALSGLGAEAESGGSSVIRFLGKMENAASGLGKNASATIKVYERLTGLSAKEFEELVKKSPILALQKVSDALRQVHDQGGSVNQVLKALGITNARDIKLLDQLTIGNTKIAQGYKAQLDAMNGKISLDQKAKIATDNLRDSQTLLNNGIHELLIVIGTPFLGATKGFTDFLVRGVHTLTDFFSSVQAGQNVLGYFGKAVGQVGAAGQLEFSALRTFVVTAFSAIAAVWNTVLYPVLKVLAQIWLTIQTAVVTAVGIVLNVVVAVFTGITSFLSAVFQPLFGKSMGGIKFSLSNLADKFAEWAGTARAYIVAVGTIAAALPPVFVKVGQAMALVLKGIIQTLAGWASDAKAYFIAAGQYAGAFAGTLGDVARNIGTIISGITDIFSSFVIAARNTFVTFALPIFKSGIDLYSGFVDGVGRFLAGARTFFFDYVVKPVQAGVEFLRPAYDRVVKIVQGAVGLIGKVLAPLGTVLSALGIGLGDALTAASSAAFGAVGSLADQGAGAANAAYAKAQADAVDKAKSTASGVKDAINGGLNAAAQGVASFIDKNGGGAALNAGMAKVTSGLNGLKATGSDLQNRFAVVGQSLGSNLKAGAAQGVQGAVNLKTGFNQAGQAITGLSNTARQSFAQVQADIRNTTTAAQQLKSVVGLPSQATAGPARAPIDLSGLGGATKKAKAAPVTAADIAALDTYKKSLKGMSLGELEAAKATAIHANDKSKLRAILGEINKREAAHAKGLKTSGIALTDYKTSLKGMTEATLEQQKAMAKAAGDSAKYRAIVAELTLRHHAHAKAVQTSGIALTDLAKALRSMSDAELASRAASAKLRGDHAAYSVVVAEQTRRTKAAGTAAQQHAASVKILNKEIGDLNDRFQLQVDQGKVTDKSLLSYQQHLETLRDRLAKLPEPLRAVGRELLSQGYTLTTAGQKVIAYNAEIGKLKDAVKDWTYAELLAAKARVVASGGDQAKLDLIDAQIQKYKDLTDAKAASLHAESQASLTKGQQEDLTAEYEGKKTAAEGNLAALYDLEVEYGARIQGLKDDQARADAEKSSTEVKNKYAELFKNQALSDEKRKQLEADQAAELLAISTHLNSELIKDETAKNKGLQSAKKSLDDYMLTVDTSTRDAIRKHSLESIQKKLSDLESEQAAELDQADLTEVQKLAIQQKYQKLLIDRKQAETDQQKVIDQQTETDRYTKALKDAEEKLGAGAEYNRAAAALEAEHASNVAAINKGLEDGLRDYTLKVKRDTGKQLVSAQKEESAAQLDAAKKNVADTLDNLDVTDAAQRQSARSVLTTWLTTYSAMGRAGKAAVGEITAALKKLEDAGGKARIDAAKLVKTSPAELTTTFQGDLRKIGKVEDASDAQLKAEDQFTSLKDAYKKNLDEVDAALTQFAEKRDADLTPDEVKTRDALLANKALYQSFLAQLAAAAQAAGKKAADDFTAAATLASKQADLALGLAQREAGLITEQEYQRQLNAYAVYMRGRVATFKAGSSEQLQASVDAVKAEQAATTRARTQADAEANAALALAEKNGALLTSKGGDGAALYKAGLKTALAFFQGRLDGLKGSDDQTNAERDTIQKTIAELNDKILNFVNDSPLTRALDTAAGLFTGSTGFSSLIKTSLDGLSAYFKAGGSGGGSKSVLLGAAAFVSGLAAVFQTGDSEMDKVTNTFVNGVTTVLGKLATGDTFGAIIAGVATVVSTIVDIFSGGANSAKKAADEITAATSGIKIFDLSKYAKTVSAGGFFGFLGFKKSEIDQEAIGIAKTLGDSLYSAISTGMLDGIKAGKSSFGQLGIDIRKSLADQILQGLIDGFLKSAVFQASVQPFLDKYITAMKSGNAQALVEAASGLQGAIATGNSQLQAFYQNVLVPAGQQLGVFNSANVTGTPTTSASNQLGLISAPTGVMAAPQYQLEYTAAITALTPVLKELTPAVRALVDQGIHVSAESAVHVTLPNSDLRAHALYSGG